ncbi:zinc ribbon domain-containing protein [Helicobacter mustelae]|uniref:C4-type zinc ribbon domain-containing protein n=1 Tax=Helicobacter mustelae (strain ATCC 43772 / CCUG 25715 / CIP 103759 / LMG 18044 / NCTC 12198 / R85-136P) TaxID=679897 RepID=D3UJC4_HELM1|nr:C4-type zinc ribbon domain-containing protein [Helicobacter mustelae]CBG40599.1 putative hypothetical protein [Helicobacter mustelae 12198]SQH72096.1 putative zinc ribbon domain-containing protein [Helicobacter mustelae]STP13240.1 putative zinc ribbon domain-containing protein [Helicobacter mustelae]
MNKHLQQLIQAANLDKAIDLLEPKILQERSKIEALLHEKSKKESQITLLKEEQDELDLRIKNAQNTIEESSIRIENAAKKRSEVKSEREINSLAIEEDLAKEQLSKANQDIQRIEQEKERKKEKVLEIEKEILQIQDGVAAQEAASAKEIETIKAEQERLYIQKQELYASLDNKLAVFYEKIRKWAKNTSVVPIKKKACGGCFIRINDRVFAEVKQSNDIVNCPHCGRILYIQD